jgi:hypothetical protein
MTPADLWKNKRFVPDVYARALAKVLIQSKAELRKLCENPTYLEVATKLTDALLASLSGLNFFEWVIGVGGKKRPITELFTLLEKDILNDRARLASWQIRPLCSGAWVPW